MTKKYLILILFSPLILIAIQECLNFPGFLGYLFYKLAFILVPLWTCRQNKINPITNIIKIMNWKNGFKSSLGLGFIMIVIFWIVYFSFGHSLISESLIRSKMDLQFHVNIKTILIIAPFTILFNSFLEEFFYRGFCFGQLKSSWLAALVFTLQHAFFTYHWFSITVLVLVMICLFSFSILLQKCYLKNDTLVSPWIVHAMGDVAMMSIGVHILLI